MLVKIITEIIVDLDVQPDDVINSDSIGDYKAQLDSDVGNTALHYLTQKLSNNADIKIISTEPCHEGIDEYGSLLNEWNLEYPKRIKKYEK